MFGWGRARDAGRAAGRLAAVLLIAISAAGCTVAASPSPLAPAATGTETPASPTASPVAPATAATPAATPTASAQPPAVPASGVWNGLRWTSDGKPPVVEATGDPVKPTPGLSVTTYTSIFGWSKGYVGFKETQFQKDDSAELPTVSIVAQSSVDGLSWKTGDLLSGLGQVSGILRVLEGPAGLLAVGYGMAATCGPPPSVRGLWLSTDGVAWSSLKVPFGSDSIYTIDAGSAGYVATGIHPNGEPALWTATDPARWTASTPPVSARTGSVQDATAFSGGFVIVGAVKGEEGCGLAAVKPSLWWSADGKAWARQTLPGAPTASDSWMTVARLSDDLLFATASTMDAASEKSTTTCWTSRDGRTWTTIAPPPSVERFMTDGSRAIADTFDDKSARHFWAFEPDGSIRELTQSGAVPPDANWSAELALGPAGLLMLVEEGNRFFLGVPTN